jgi:hypothetical protein
MADYLLVFRGGSMPEGEEAQAQVMKAWTDWFSELGDAVKDGGNPTSGKATHIGADGAVGGGSPDASGYSILTADSLDQATTLAKGCPVLAGGASIDIYETFEVM